MHLFSNTIEGATVLVGVGPTTFGTGFIVEHRARAYVVTCRHVILEASTSSTSFLPFRDLRRPSLHQADTPYCRSASHSIIQTMRLQARKPIFHGMFGTLSGPRERRFAKLRRLRMVLHAGNQGQTRVTIDLGTSAGMKLLGAQP
jgi:hypothetical protein